MNTIVVFAVWFLAAFALIRASIVEPPESSKSPRQIGTVLRGMQWWHPPFWVVAVLLAVPLYTVWTACRFALYLVAFVGAVASAWLATVTSMDGRALIIHRLVGWTEVHP